MVIDSSSCPYVHTSTVDVHRVRNVSAPCVVNCSVCVCTCKIECVCKCVYVHGVVGCVCMLGVGEEV